MPSSLLFGLSADARVFGLSTAGTKWREFVYLGLEFKQLSAVPHFLWAIGSDRQVYLHVHGLDTPIRVKEEAYENERWTPITGFSNRLLPTDRYNFSNQDGTCDRSLNKIRLPSMAWQWEGAWHLELNLNGQPLDHDGWTYAVDFPATYYPTKQWSSCVRRRKWVRYRRYSALNSWCAIAPLHKDATKEPFIWVSIGYHVNGEKMAVWAVTALGRIIFRTDVSATTPEGRTWKPVPLPPGCEASQVSTSSQLVWVVLSNGTCLVRTKVTRDSLIGEAWVEVEHPSNKLLVHVVVGSYCVWAISKDNTVWFRTGIKGDLAGNNNEMASGNAWVEIPGKMAMLSVSNNDQLFAIGSEDRTGVTPETPTGKMWRRVCAPTQLSRTSSVASIFQPGTTNSSFSTKEKRHRSWTSLNRHSGSHETARILDMDSEGACHSAPVMTRAIPQTFQSIDCGSLQSFGSSQSSGISSNFIEQQESYLPNQSEIIEARPKSDEPNDIYDNSSHPVMSFAHNTAREMNIKNSTHAWSPVRSVGSVVATEAHTEADSSVFDSDLFTGVYGEVGEKEEADDYLYWTDSEAYWSWVEAGACNILHEHLPNWFEENPNAVKLQLDRPWRIQILNNLKQRLPDSLNLEQFEKAVSTCSWVKSIPVKSQIEGEVTYQLCCILELEWIENEKVNNSLDYSDDEKSVDKDNGIITVSTTDHTETRVQLNVLDLLAVIRCSNPGFPRLALIRSPDLSATRLQFTGEDELEEWITELSEMCCKVRNIAGPPHPDSLWLTTLLGDIYVLDISHLKSELKVDNEGLYTMQLPIFNQTAPFSLPLPNGFFRNTSITIYGCVFEKAERFAVNLTNDASSNCDIQLHFNPRFADNEVIRNARRNGMWGPEDRRSCQPFTPGHLFVIEIISEENCFRIFVNGMKFTDFAVRDESALSAASVSHIGFTGDVSITKVLYKSPNMILNPPNLFFRRVPGHLRKVEAAGGVVWGLGFNQTPWVYVGDRHTEGDSNAHAMVDTHTYYVYENQRWNPLTGYTSHGLPTDRHMWSDVTGRHRRTKESTRLLSPRWQWIGDWEVDSETPGGVDNQGWQYAVDFPSSYHGKKSLTDYVRRRRWVRKARLVTAGPWVELGHTRLLDCSLHCENGQIVAWAVANNGDVLYRQGVSASCPMGISWEHISCDQPMLSIASAPGHVWGVFKGGGACWRFGISASNPMGLSWEAVDAPKSAGLKMISVGEKGVWALDTSGRLSVRQEVTNVFPSGSHWFTLPLESDNSVQDIEGLPSTPSVLPSKGFCHVTSGSHIWAINSAGRLLQRINVSQCNPAGTTWLFHIQAPWLYACGW